jgi:hypothetical protein
VIFLREGMRMARLGGFITFGHGLGKGVGCGGGGGESIVSENPGGKSWC